MTSSNVALVMGILCISGGITGYLRTRSIPSIAAGCTVGALYLWSAYNISQGLPKGYQGAFAASAILFLSSVPRAAKGPIPAALSVLGAGAGYYYRKAYFN